MNIYTDHEEIVKEVIFEFVSLYGLSNQWDDDIKEIFEEEIERRIKDKSKHK